MRVLSLFDGVSCAYEAIKRSGFEIESYHASEVDKYAVDVAKRNHPDVVHVGDVRHVTKEMVGEIDLLIGGSPCQDLSIAKHGRKGLEGDRSSLFYEYLRILRETNPRYFILENVASMPKEAKEIITKELGVEPIMIDAALVSAQRRKRYFWTNIPGVTLPEEKGIKLTDILETDVDEKYFISDETLNKILEKMRTARSLPQAFRIHDPEGKAVTLSAGGGGTGGKTGLYLIIPEATKKGYAIAKDGSAVDLSFPSSKTRRGRVGEIVKNLMTSQNIYAYTGGRVRKLTPTECERLQGLNPGHTAGQSDAQRYKMCGNAFNVDVIAHILSFIPKEKNNESVQ